MYSKYMKRIAHIYILNKKIIIENYNGDNRNMPPNLIILAPALVYFLPF